MAWYTGNRVYIIALKCASMLARVRGGPGTMVLVSEGQYGPSLNIWGCNPCGPELTLEAFSPQALCDMLNALPESVPIDGTETVEDVCGLVTAFPTDVAVET